MPEARADRLWQVRILFALPGLHAVQRGAEVAFLSVGSHLATMGHEVTMIGTGPPMPDRPYRYLQGFRVPRERFERFPAIPALRSDTNWEELTFLPSLLRLYRPREYDVTVTCSYPYVNWALRRPALGGKRPKHVFVTQNGDWPAQSDKSEFGLFGCDGLVCINPDFYERNKARYRAALIPNGVDTSRFRPGSPQRGRFGLPEGMPIVLMVSAMIESKNVDHGIRAVAALSDAHLVVAGDGPMRGELQALAEQLLPGRYHPLSVASNEMPAVYRSADLFLHLSRDESFGNVYVEAMACGLPIVAYDLPRTRWIVGDDEFLADDREGTVARLSDALNHGAEGRAARVARARAFDWGRIAERYLTFFAEVTAGLA